MIHHEDCYDRAVADVGERRSTRRSHDLIQSREEEIVKSQPDFDLEVCHTIRLIKKKKEKMSDRPQKQDTSPNDATESQSPSTPLSEMTASIAGLSLTTTAKPKSESSKTQRENGTSASEKKTSPARDKKDGGSVADTWEDWEQAADHGVIPLCFIVYRNTHLTSFFLAGTNACFT